MNNIYSKSCLPWVRPRVQSKITLFTLQTWELYTKHVQSILRSPEIFLTLFTLVQVKTMRSTASPWKQRTSVPLCFNARYIHTYSFAYGKSEDNPHC